MAPRHKPSLTTFDIPGITRLPDHVDAAMEVLSQIITSVHWHQVISADTRKHQAAPLARADRSRYPLVPGYY